MSCRSCGIFFRRGADEQEQRQADMAEARTRYKAVMEERDAALARVSKLREALRIAVRDLRELGATETLHVLSHVGVPLPDESGEYPDDATEQGGA